MKLDLQVGTRVVAYVPETGSFTVGTVIGTVIGPVRPNGTTYYILSEQNNIKSGYHESYVYPIGTKATKDQIQALLAILKTK